MIVDKLDEDFYYHFFNGTLINAYDYFGVHIKKRDNEICTEFLLYAPNAIKVCLIGEFNNYEEVVLNQIKKGFYYLCLNDNLEFKEYKYVLYTENEKLYKADPYAFSSTLRPDTNSIIKTLRAYDYKRKKIKQLSIYEMHLSSWDNLDNLIIYLKGNNFSHVEFLPVTEYPLDDSWGYMTTGYYSLTKRYDYDFFIKLIDDLHRNNIGVILDWVVGHFCKDDFGLYKFDGTYLYEYEEEEKRENKDWGTANFDLSKGVTQSFLISNALFWMKYYKIDGFRFDAVRNIIYYLGNEDNGINIDAINFLKKLNTEIKKYDKNTIIIAEDSSSYPRVTKDLGFDYKWNMGWMNDTLSYFQLDPLYRKYNHKLITFSFSYFYKEKYILPISHDEVVHLKKSLFNKMFGDFNEKMASLKVFFGFMYTFPGKKLIFMGQEFAVYDEWDFKSNLKFDLYKDIRHVKLNLFFKDIQKMYINEISLKNDSLKSFDFIEPNNNEQSVFVYARTNVEHLIIIMNCLPIKYEKYRVGVLCEGAYEEIINSDEEKYGGSGFVNSNLISSNSGFQNKKYSLEISLPPLSIIILKYKK